MISSVLGVLCGTFIAADYFGYHSLNGLGYFGCWVIVILESCSRIGVNYYEKNDD